MNVQRILRKVNSLDQICQFLDEKVLLLFANFKQISPTGTSNFNTQKSNESIYFNMISPNINLIKQSDLM